MKKEQYEDCAEDEEACAAAIDWNDPQELTIEHELAIKHGVKWQHRGPPAPEHGGRIRNTDSDAYLAFLCAFTSVAATAVTPLEEKHQRYNRLQSSISGATTCRAASAVQPLAEQHQR